MTTRSAPALGRYVLVEELDAGGMGAIYVALQHRHHSQSASPPHGCSWMCSRAAPRHEEAHGALHVPALRIANQRLTLCA